MHYFLCFFYIRLNDSKSTLCVDKIMVLRMALIRSTYSSKHSKIWVVTIQKCIEKKIDRWSMHTAPPPNPNKNICSWRRLVCGPATLLRWLMIDDHALFNKDIHLIYQPAIFEHADKKSTAATLFSSFSFQDFYFYDISTAYDKKNLSFLLYSKSGKCRINLVCIP